MTTKTEITDKFRYNECVGFQAKLELVRHVIESITEDEEMITEADYDQFIDPAMRLLETVAKHAGERAKTYIEAIE